MENNNKNQQERIKELVQEIEEMQLPEPYKSETFRAKLALIVGASTQSENVKVIKKPRETKTGIGGRGNKSDVAIKIDKLLETDFFRTPKTLRDIQEKLQEQGYNVDLTELSPRLLFFVREGMLTRTKNEKKRFAYLKNNHNHTGSVVEESSQNLSGDDTSDSSELAN